MKAQTERAEQAEFDLTQARGKVVTLEAENTARGKRCREHAEELHTLRAWSKPKQDQDKVEAAIAAEVAAINANNAEMKRLNDSEIPRLISWNVACQGALSNATQRDAEAEFEAATLAWLDAMNGDAGKLAKRLQDAYAALGKKSGLRLDATPVSAVSAA